MGVPTDMAGLAVAVAAGVVKLTQRADRIISEEVAVVGALALPAATRIRPPSTASMQRALVELAAETRVDEPDPLGGDRAEIEALLDPASRPKAGRLIQLMEKYIPERIVFRVSDPDGEAAEMLKKRADAWGLSDAEISRLAFYLAPGKDRRSGNVAWRLSMAVVQTLAEFAVDNQEWIVGDDRARPIVVAVLTRVADPAINDVDSVDDLLHFALKATLNGALDSREHLDGDRDWLEALLGAVAKARDRADVPNDFLVGLLRGRGYRSLVSTLLKEGSGYLSQEDAEAYEQILGDVLGEAGRLAQDSGAGFEGFFIDHWDDLARAGLKSLHTHGPAILADENPILRETLLAAVGSLAQPGTRDLLSAATLEGAVEAAIAAVAANPELLTDRDDRGSVFLRHWFQSIAAVVADHGIRSAVSREGLERVLRATAATAAEHPELLIEDDALAQAVVGGVLGGLADAKGLQLDLLASAAVGGALGAIGENPGLLKTSYAPVIAGLATRASVLVRERSLTRVQGADLLAVVTEVVATNPELFVVAEQQLARLVVDAVVKEAGEDADRLLTGAALVEVAEGALQVVAVRGRALLDGSDAATLATGIGEVVAAGLTRARAELGMRLDRTTVPVALTTLVQRWATGEISDVAADDPDFQTVFANLAEEVALAA